jgi:hypothetical protein
MASTIRISDQAKKKMQKLIHYLGFKTNRQISQREMLDLLIEVAIQDKEVLLKQLKPTEQSTDWKNDPIFQEIDLEMEEDTSEKVKNIVYGK